MAFDKRDSVENKALRVVTQHLRLQGYDVDDVSRNAAHKGYDLVARRSDELLRVEVKGCTVAWGIPDPYWTEFDEERRLVADFLYVVYFVPDEDVQLCAIPRAALDPSMVAPRQGYRISGRFKKAAVMKRFLTPVLK